VTVTKSVEKLKTRTSRSPCAPQPGNLPLVGNGGRTVPRVRVFPDADAIGTIEGDPQSLSNASDVDAAGKLTGSSPVCGASVMLPPLVQLPVPAIGQPLPRR